MSWQWSLYTLPELKHLPLRERVPIVRKCYWKPLRHWQTWAAVGVSLAVDGLYFILPLLSGPSRGWNIMMALTFCVVIVAVGLAAFQVVIAMARPYIRAEVGGLCLRCGYDLRSSLARCPECGAVIADTALKTNEG